MEKMKFRIKDADQSKRLQQVLFKLGYKWSTGNTIQAASSPFLLTSFWKCGDICHSGDFSYEGYTEKDTESFIAEHTSEFDIDAPIELQYTRDGRKVLEIYKFKSLSNEKKNCIFAVVENKSGGSHSVSAFNHDGSYYLSQKHPLDIVTRKPEVTETMTIQGVEIAVTLNPNDKTVSVKLKG